MNKKVKKIFLSTVVGLSSIFYCSNALALELTTDTKLDGDVTDGIHVSSGSNVTLDLNGYKVTGLVETVLPSDSNKATIVNEGTLIITDSSASKSGLVEGGSTGSYAVLNRNGNLTINGGNFSIVLSAYKCASSNNGKCNTYNGPSLISNGWYNGEQNTSGAYSELTINGGVFNGGINNVKNDENGKLIINNGTFNAVKYSDINPINSNILMGENILTGGKLFQLNDGILDSNIAVQMVGSDTERTFEVLGGKYDEDSSYGSRITISGSKNDENIYTKFVIENIKLQKIDAANLNIKDLTIKNVETTNSNSLNSISLKAGGNIIVENVISGKKLLLNGTGENNKLTITNLRGGEFTTNGNVEIKDSILDAIKIGTSTASNVKLSNVKATLLTANKANTNVVIEGGEYGKVVTSNVSSAKTASNGSMITLDTDTNKNIPVIVDVIATGAGTININSAKVSGNIETNYKSNINIKDGEFDGSLIINDIEKNSRPVRKGFKLNSYCIW